MGRTRRVGLVVAVVTVLGTVMPGAQAIVSPDAPTGLTATPDDEFVQLAWEAPADNGVAIVGYRVYVTVDDTTQTFDTGSAAASYTHTGLVNGTEYTYEVAAVNALSNEGPRSDPASATPVGLPSEPTKLAASAFWAGQKLHVTLGWQPPGDDGGSPILGYRVFRDDDPIAELPADAGSFSERISAEGATYTVRAFNAVGEGDPAALTIARNANSFKAVDVTLRDAPGDVVLSDGSPYSGVHDISRLFDGTWVSRFSGLQDVLVFQPWAKRYFSVQHPAINDGQAVSCDDNFSRVTMYSRQNLDWFTTLGQAADGSSLVGDASIRCWTKGNADNYLFDFPNYIGSPDAGAECGVITKVNASTFTFEAPATCLADIYRENWSKGTFTREPITEDAASAPFLLTATLQ